jgi:hypothetical protein
VLVVSRDEWLLLLEAERVTHSSESFAELVDRLDMERPESVVQLQLRRKLSRRASGRVFLDSVLRGWS